MVKIFKDAENLPTDNNDDNQNFNDYFGKYEQFQDLREGTLSDHYNTFGDWKGGRIEVLSSDVFEDYQSRDELIRFYVDDMLKLPVFSKFNSKSRDKKQAILGSKRLSLDSIGTTSDSKERQKKISIHVPDRMAKRKGDDVEVIVSSALVN